MTANEFPAILLKRDHHAERTRDVFKQLKNDKMFTDVTLASDDNKTISAHKAILGYSSPYLYSILNAKERSSENTVSLPVKYLHLQSLVEYIYLGETRVEVSQVKEFLDIANRLQIRGLWFNDKDNKNTAAISEDLKKECMMDETLKPQLSSKEFKTNDTKSQKEANFEEKYSCNECEFKASLKRDLKNHKEALHTKVAETIQCEECGYIGTKSGLYNHKLLHAGVKLFCDRCDYSTLKSYHLKEHTKNIHEPAYVYCDECVFQTKRLGKLKTHKEQEHEGILFECNVCEYKAKSLSRMEDHKKGIHEGNKYKCDQCEYTCVFKGPLLQHKQVNHDEVRYECNICKYKATRSGNLRAHERAVHMNEKRKPKEISTPAT